MTRILASFLKPGGALIVADFLKGGMPKAHKHVLPAEGSEGWERNVSHMDGFEEQDIRRVFEDAGLQSFVFNSDVAVGDEEDQMRVFIAKGIHS